MSQARERRLRNLLPCSLTRKQARVWKAEVGKRCGRSRRAAKMPRAVLEKLLAEDSCYEAVPVVLSLLDLFARTGKPQELGRFCRDFDPAGRFRKLPASSLLPLIVAFGVTQAGEPVAPRVRACAGQILQILPYHPDLPLPRAPASLHPALGRGCLETSGRKPAAGSSWTSGSLPKALTKSSPKRRKFWPGPSDLASPE